MNKFLTFAAALAAFSFVNVDAQTFQSVRVHFNDTVQVASNTLPAGDYTITTMKSNGETPLLRFSSDHGTSVVVFAARVERSLGEPAAHTEVLLEKSGSSEFVTRIEIEGSSEDLVFTH